MSCIHGINMIIVLMLLIIDVVLTRSLLLLVVYVMRGGHVGRELIDIGSLADLLNIIILHHLWIVILYSH